MDLFFLCVVTSSINGFAFESSSPKVFAEDSLTLHDCLDIAKKNNTRLIQAEKSIEGTRTGITAAYSSYYPSLNLSSGYNKGGDGYIGDGSYSSTIGFRHPIYQGGYVRAGTEIAKFRVKLAEQSYRLTESEVFLSVKETFFKILQKLEQLTVVEKILERRKEALVLIKLKYEAGRESFPAVGEEEANLLQAEYDKLSAEEELSLAKIELNLLLGRPARKEISVKYEEQYVEFPPREELIEETKVTKPEICTERVSREVLRSQLKQAKSNYFPTLSLSSSYGYGGSSDNIGEQDKNWSAGLSLTLPIFNGFLTRAKVKESTLAIQKEDAKIREVGQRVEEEVEQAYSNWLLAKKNVEVNKKTLEASRDMYELTRLQYEQGREPYFFLQQKESSLTRAEYSYNNALFNLRVATARLEKACGR